MMTVETVLGSIETHEIGRTYVHEHVFIQCEDVRLNYSQDWGDEDTRIDNAAEQLTALSAQGIQTIIDPTVMGIGRDIERLQKVAKRVPQLNIVVATGIYTYRDLPFFYAYRGPQFGEREPMVAQFISDIRDGISGTNIKAGLLKCAIDEPGMTPGVERAMRAIAQAHLQTEVPIMVHTHPGSQSGREVKRVLCDEEGIHPSRIMLAHSGDTSDVSHLVELADHGFILGMDRFGLNGIVPGVTFESRIQTLVEMCRLGYANQIGLSQDSSVYFDWMSSEVREQMFPQWNYLHIGNDVLPELRKRGITDKEIGIMLVDTPRNYLAGTK